MDLDARAGPEIVARQAIAEHRATCAEDGRLALHRHKRQNGAMPSVQIKDVPPRTHAVLRRRAAAANQSLQEYLRARLIDDASSPTLDEVLERASGRSAGELPLGASADAVRSERDRR